MAKRKGPRIDKSALTFGEPSRLRSSGHLSYVHEQVCCVCKATPVQAHHLTFAQPRARGSKSSDEFTVGICPTHHLAAHAAGDERRFWASVGIDPLEVALGLWTASQALR